MESEKSLESLIIALADDEVPIANLLRLNEKSASNVSAMISMLIKRTASTLDDQKELVEDAESTLKMLQMAGILDVDGEKVTPGKMFPEFKEFASEYFDLDNVIIRTLGISRQEFDEIKREYTEVTSKTKDFSDILTTWSELPPETKLGIVRGIFIQRGVMANILNNTVKGVNDISKHCSIISSWLGQWTK